MRSSNNNKENETHNKKVKITAADIDVSDKTKLPITLQPIHLMAILDRGERQIYEWLGELVRKENSPFRIIKLGREYKIPRDPFFDWFEGRA